MKCIYCLGDTRVVNSRLQKRENNVWRRRTCLICGTVFTTEEAADLSGSIRVLNNKQLEAFQRDKLYLSIYDSLRHRKTAQQDATELTDTILTTLYPHMHDATITRMQIIEVTASVLTRFDKVAATSYTAFHPIK